MHTFLNQHLHHAFIEFTSSKTQTYFFFTPRSKQKKERRVTFLLKYLLETEMTKLQTSKAAVYLQPGWPVTSPGLLRQFW